MKKNSFGERDGGEGGGGGLVETGEKTSFLPSLQLHSTPPYQ